MTEKFLKKLEVKQKKPHEIAENEIDESIKESPEGFMGWFLKLKNSISELSGKFLSDKAIKKAIIYASIPFAVLQASEQGVKAEEVKAKLSPPGASEILKEKIEFSIKDKRPELEIKPEQLVALTDKESQEKLSQKINAELFAFDNLSDDFDKTISEKPDLFPKNIIEKVANGGRVFDFSGTMKNKIDEVNQYALDMQKTDNIDLKQTKRKVRANKILDNGKLNFEALAKVMPEIILAQKMSVLVHELGHEQEAMHQGAQDVSTKFNLFGGYTEYYGKIKNEAAFNVAGINADKAYGEFLVNNLRGQDAPSQFLAIAALIAKSEGALYAISTNFMQTMQEHKGNDIIEYSKNTGVPVQNIALGLVTDFILNKDNRELIKVALGQDGAKLSDTTIAPFYELGEFGPIIGIGVKSVF